MRNPILASIVTSLALAPAAAMAISIGSLVQDLEHVGPKPTGSPERTSLQVSVSVSPSGPPTSVWAIQGSVRKDLSFFGSSAYPDLYAFVTTDSSLLSLAREAWQVTAERGVETASAWTHGVDNPQILPLMAAVSVIPNGLTPIVQWTAPSLSGYEADVFAIRAYEKAGLAASYASGRIDIPAEAFAGPTTSVFQLPAGSLEAGHEYYFEVVLNDLESWGLENRSRTFTSGYYWATPVPEPGSVLLLGAGLAGLCLHARRRRSG